MPPKKNKKIQYYTVNFEKFIEIITEVDNSYFILCDKIKEEVEKNEYDKWTDQGIPEFMDTFIMFSSFKEFLDEKINNPTEEEVQFSAKNNIKDVLFEKEELALLQHLWLEFEARRQLLLEKYSFSCIPS
jgi:hypothetical protein